MMPAFLGTPCAASVATKVKGEQRDAVPVPQRVHVFAQPGHIFAVAVAVQDVGGRTGPVKVPAVQPRAVRRREEHILVGEPLPGASRRAESPIVGKINVVSSHIMTNRIRR